MKMFIFATVFLALLLSCCILNDVYCHSVCQSIENAVQNGGYEGAKKAVNTFKRNEFLLKCSVDNGYINEAEVSLESLVVAYECSDVYEIKRYAADCIIRVNRIQTALFI